MDDETPREWCARTWAMVHPEYGQVTRWRVEGCSPPYETQWETLEEIARPSSADELEFAIERAIANNPDQKKYRALGWLEKYTRRAWTRKGWPPPIGHEAEDETTSMNGSPQSMLSQMQQYSLALQRLLIQTDERRSRQLSAFNEALFTRVQSLEAERRQYLDAIESREDQQVDRMIRLQKSEQIHHALQALISVGRAKILGGPQPGEQGEALGKALQSFWNTLTEDQVTSLLSTGALTFRPEQLTALMTLMKGQGLTADSEGPKSLPEAQPPDAAAPPTGPSLKDVLLTARHNLAPEDYANLLNLLQSGGATREPE